MIILANRTYGGFHHTRECVEHFNLRSCYNRTDFENRIDPELIDFYHHHDRGDIGFCYIPNEATDWDIIEYDGLEYVIYVLNGKLCQSCPE